MSELVCVCFYVGVVSLFVFFFIKGLSMTQETLHLIRLLISPLKYVLLCVYACVCAFVFVCVLFTVLW